MHGIHLMVINISKVFLDEETIDCSISARFTLKKTFATMASCPD